MLPVLQVIQAFVVPVVVISANGLLCLALYNRLASVISRARTIHKERFDLSTRLSALADEARTSPQAAHVDRRLRVLDELGHQLFDRSRMLRDCLVWLLVAVLSMIGCSLALGIASVWALFEWAALGLFVVGMLAMAAGIVQAIRELRVALDPLVFEHEMMEDEAGDKD